MILSLTTNKYVTTVKKVLREPKTSGNKELLERCKYYLTSEMESLNDPSMSKEILMLDSQIKNCDTSVAFVVAAAPAPITRHLCR